MNSWDTGRSNSCYTNGIYLGLVEASDEVIVGTEAGRFRTRSIKRLPPVQRSLKTLVQAIKGLPWNLE